MAESSSESLIRFLSRYVKNGPRPILWVGAGASAAAGYPTLAKLESLIRTELPEATETGFALLDRYVQEFGRADLANLLQQHLGVPKGPVAIHEVMARLLEARVFGSVFTTNYDRLIELALGAQKIPHTVQVLEQNFVLSSRQDVSVLKLHGDQGDWLNVVLTAASYAEFARSFPLLREQLNLSLRRHPLVFVGCSMRDPRTLGWLRSLLPSERTTLFASRVLITQDDWEQIPVEDRALLAECNVRPVLVDDYAAITRTLQEVATKLAPLAVRELVFTLTPHEDSWTVVGPTTESPAHSVPNPLRDEALLKRLSRLRTLAATAIVDGHPAYAAQLAEGKTLARELGEKLTAVLFSSDAKVLVAKRIHDKRARAQLVLRVLDVADPLHRALTERALALPWELLMPEAEHFAVERSELDVVREIVNEGSPVVPEPTTALQVAITVSAPEDQVALKYEEESLRLQQALGPLGHSAAFAEMGTVEDLVSLAERLSPQALHFSGHGLPGKLVFEDEFGCSKRVPIEDLVASLNTRLMQAGTERRFPSLFFLASCHGVSGVSGTEPAAGARDADAPADRQSRELATALGEGPSTAATLHRAGFAQVLGYFGPVSDSLCTRAEAVFYSALAQGKTTLQATSECRQSLREPFKYGEAQVRYPLAWIQLALYHRGPDQPLALPGTEKTLKPNWRDEVFVSGLPVLQHGFIGRRSLLHKIRNLVRAGQRLLLLHGVGGVGKTALATQLLRSVLATDDHDLLILPCDGLDKESDPVGKLWVQAAERARALGVSDEELRKIREQTEDTTQGFERTVELLRQKRPKLVVYADNMEDLQIAPKDAAASHSLGSWRPGVASFWQAMERLSRCGLVLASMRYRFDGPSEETWVAVEPMRIADTQRLIDTFAGLHALTEDAKRELSERCEGHPRTVVFVEQLISQKRKRSLSRSTDGSLDELLGQTHDKIREDLMLQELWRCLSEEAQQHARILSVLRRPVPGAVIESLGVAAVELRDSSLLIPTRHLGEMNGQPDWRERWDMLGVVASFVAAQPPLPDCKSVHRAVGQALKTHLEGNSDDRLWTDQEEAIHHLHAAKEGDAAWPLVEEYVICLRRQAQYREALEILMQCEDDGTTGDQLARALVFLVQMQGSLGKTTDAAAAQLDRAVDLAQSEQTKSAALHEYGSLKERQGKYGEAETLLRRTLALKEKALGVEHPSYGASLHALAVALSRQAKYADAEMLLRRTLALYEKTIGVEHSAFGDSLHELACVLREQGKYTEAETLLRRSLSLHEKVLGVEHPSIGVSLQALANVLSMQGRYTEAETLLCRSLALYEKALDVEHPDYGASLYSLAGVLSKQGKYVEAETLLRRAAELYAHAHGVEHPEYGASLISLAGVLSKQGKYVEAETLLRRVLALVEKAFGIEHPSFGISLRSLAAMLSDQGKYSEAETLQRRAFSLVEKTLGIEHPEYGASLISLAGVRSNQGSYAEAETLQRRALALYEKSLGVEHPSFGASLHALAGVLSKQGKYAEAETLLRRALALHEKAIGVEHPTYAASMHELASVLSLQGKYAEAESLLRRTLALYEKSLGIEHSEHGASMHGLAGVLSLQGKYAEAEPLLRRTLALYETSLGVEHPSLCPTLSNLAAVLAQQSKSADGIPLLLRAHTIATKVHTKLHPDVGQILFILAQVQALLSLPEARQTTEEAMAILDHCLGPAHPATQRARLFYAHLTGSSSP